MNTSLDNLTHKMQRAALGKIVDVALSRAEQDREKTMCQLVDAAKQFYGSGFSDETYENAKKVLTDPNSKWTKLINCVLDQTNPHVARTTALNLGYEAFFRGTKMIRENRVKYQCNIKFLPRLTYTSDRGKLPVHKPFCLALRNGISFLIDRISVIDCRIRKLRSLCIFSIYRDLLETNRTDGTVISISLKPHTAVLKFLRACPVIRERRKLKAPVIFQVKWLKPAHTVHI